MTHDEIIAVVQAHKDGKEIECKAKVGEGVRRIIGASRCGHNHNEWSKSCKDTPQFNFGLFDYRVKSNAEPER